jgi:hypothetical protein
MPSTNVSKPANKVSFDPLFLILLDHSFECPRCYCFLHSPLLLDVSVCSIGRALLFELSHNPLSGGFESDLD